VTQFPRNRNIAGITSLILGVMIFSTQDAIIKKLSGGYAVTEAIFVRSVVALPILLVLVQFETGIRMLRTRSFWPLVLRGLILLVSYTSYYMAIAALPLAEAVALFFTTPILVTLLSGPLLGERVSLQSWFAVFLGFLGVLVIVQPGLSVFEPAALLSLLSAATYAFAMILARQLGTSEPATVMSFYQNAVYLVGSCLIAAAFQALQIDSLPHPSLDFLVRPWTLPEWTDLGLMSACGVIAAVAMSLLTHAYRSAEANLVTVFEYTGMVWAPLWGFLFFKEVPSPTTLLGMGLIVGAGLYAARAGAKKRAT
jgi:drug/metabolite transporter (DMT)-like permease